MKKEGIINNRFKINNSMLYLAIAIIVILFLIFGQGKEKGVEEEIITEEENSGSGFLEVETFPDSAEIFIDGVSKGKSPTTIYNVGIGSHNVVIKKEGYEDFISEVTIDAGRKTFLEPNLVVKIIADEEDIIDIVEEELVEIVEEEDKIIEGVKETEEITTEAPESSDKINIGNRFTFYYDFSETEFIEKRMAEPDVFSKRYESHFIFTRFNPANIKTVDKNIDDIEKEDCTGINGQFEWLYSGQSLCIKTKDGSVVAIGGYWDKTENAELKWKLFS